MTRWRTFACVLAAISTLAAREATVAGCGTYRDRETEDRYLHRQSETRRARGVSRAMRAKMLAASAALTNQDFGNIAVIDDADGAISQRNPFDLGPATLSFIPSASAAARYRVQTGADSYDASAAQAGVKLEGLGDDDSRQVFLPFAFPFFGTTWRDMWVNSDGNISFGAADANSTDRSLGRLVGGPPRIAPLFSDLDPSSARPLAGVRVLAEAAHVVITWLSVPAYSDARNGMEQIFQVRLFPDGRIEFALSSIHIVDAVTGISPGGMNGTLALVSFKEGAPDEYSGPIAESFSGQPAIDPATVAQKFYATHEDAYDYLVIYNAENAQAGSGAVAYELGVRNHGSGFGDATRDAGSEYGSNRRLQAILNLGPLSQYPAGLSDPVPARGSIGDTTLSVLAHETGHLFLAFASVRDPNNAAARPMLGRALVHWSFNFNSDASFLEGNRIQDGGQGANPRFLTTGTVQAYSALDQYLMGFRGASEVGPTFLVTGSDFGDATAPRTGVGISGGRRDVSVDDIIAVEGRRTPDNTVAQRRFRFAFILIVRAGQTVQAADVARVDGWRQAFESYYAKSTSNRATADTSLKRAVQLSAVPAAGVLAGADGSAMLSLSAPAVQPVTFTLSSSVGAIAVPASVTVAAGSSQTFFAIHGVHEGVDQLTVTPADSSYETTVANIQVQADPSTLQLELVSSSRVAGTSGAPLPPLHVRVIDINRLPYSGVRVTAAAPGSLDHSAVITDQNGVASFVWTPNSASAILRANLDGVPAATATVTLAAPPAVAAGAVVNAASFSAGITPGSLATVFGSALSAGVVTVLAPPLPFGVSNVQIMVNGIAAQLSYVSDSQINFVVPVGLTGTAATFEVVNPLGRSGGSQVALQGVSPGIFAGANNTAAVLIANTGLTTFTRPAHVGDALEIYTTGLGPVTASTAYPGFQETLTRPQVLIGGTPAEVLIATPSPQFPGLYQINVVVASGTPPGDQPMVIVLNGIRSNEPLVRIQ